MTKRGILAAEAKRIFADLAIGRATALNLSPTTGKRAVQACYDQGVQDIHPRPWARLVRGRVRLSCTS